MLSRKHGWQPNRGFVCSNNFWTKKVRYSRIFKGTRLQASPRYAHAFEIRFRSLNKNTYSFLNMWLQNSKRQAPTSDIYSENYRHSPLLCDVFVRMKGLRKKIGTKYIDRNNSLLLSPDIVRNKWTFCLVGLGQDTTRRRFIYIFIGINIMR